MTAKDYLSQGYRLDQRIKSKMEQISNLNDLATKATVAMSGMPHSPIRGSSTMANAVEKIIDLENEINAEIERLVILKQNIIDTIQSVEDMEYQTLLEKRYLCFQKWEQIAIDMDYSIDNVFKVHKKALAAVVVPESRQ
jgi:hypothetical protein